MKNIRLIIICLSFSITTIAQQNTQFIPEFSLGQPIGAFSEDTFNTKNGFGGGLHLEKQNLWKVFGLGLYAGYHSYTTDFSTAFPSQINDANFNSRVYVDYKNLNWKSIQVALGPTINFNLTNKLQLQGFTKAGIAKVSYPEYRYYVDGTTPTNEQFTLFEANTPKETQSNFNFMILSGFRFNYNFSKTFGMHVGANFTHIKGLKHIYTSRNIEISGDESPSILYETLQNTSEITETYVCNINSVNATIGITINIGGSTKPPKEQREEEPEIPFKSNTPEEDYNCESVVYEAPGYNEYVILSQTPYAVFEWSDNNSRRLKEDKSYQLIFFIKENGEYKEVDKRVMNSKKQFKIGLNPKMPYPDNALYWQIVPVNVSNETFCPEQAKMMRLLIFKDKNEALKKLPACLTQSEEVKTKPGSTNFFRKKQ